MNASRLLLAMVFLCAGASATTYYVDPAGSNANDGLSPQTPWRTLLKVGIASFSPGDVILFKRDGVWNEWLTPPSSGAAGNLIKFDAYGNGQPPEFSGRYTTTSAQWTNTSGSVWQISLSATQAIPQLKFVQFGSTWGNSQTSQSALAHNRDWYYDSGSQILYVYSSGGNPVSAYGSVTPIILSGQSLININSVNYIEIQHIKLDWYDSYGVQVQGNSDHIWLANILADSQVPNAAVPIGFYVHSSSTPADIHIYNTDAHRNYVGYRFDNAATQIELKNCRAYANRTFGLMDNTGAVTYSYCHFYANNIATGISTDITGTPGPIDGGHNLPADTPPNVRGFMQYPARITVTYDDPGLIDGSHQYIESLLPMFQQKSFPLSIAVVTGYPLSQQLVPTFQSWINSGWDVNTHSVSHQYFVFPNAFALQYTGTTASSVTLSLSSKHLVITAPGDPSAQVNWDLSSSGTDIVPSGLDTLGGIVFTLLQRGVFSVVADPNMKSAVKSEDLADIAPIDITSTPYTLQMDKARLMTDEMNWAMAWMSANLTGLPANRVYVYPGSYEDTSTEAIAVAAGYAGARGSGVLQPSPNAATVMASGINVQNILSQGIAPNFQNLTDAQLANKLRALVFKSAVWGLPIGIFWHVNELPAHQVEVMLNTLKQSGATLMTNTQLVNYLLGTQQNPGTTYYADSVTGLPVDVRPTAASPVADAGASLTSEFKFDLMGTDQTLFGSSWEIGAYALVPESDGRVK
ncbi:MAG TPA: right-handed parallel beta-helix repeat-containing protein [Terriglobales bacterium]|nr:right-handed parallel beta-helix repeat-containing protein [Terriglobales bacterium]